LDKKNGRYHNYLKEVLISKEELQQRIAELGAEISAHYAGKELLLVCILPVVFFSP